VIGVGAMLVGTDTLTTHLDLIEWDVSRMFNGGEIEPSAKPMRARFYRLESSGHDFRCSHFKTTYCFVSRDRRTRGGGL
jgi:hypothetical protein